MKKKKPVWIFLLFAMGLLFMLSLTNGCEKPEEDIILPPDSIIVFNPDLTSDTVTDIDGNVYKTIIIGTQTWMAENLKVTKFNDGTDIPLVTDEGEWESLETPGYCWFNNDEKTYKKTYGVLYNWTAAKYACPEGWQLPDWEYLIQQSGGYNIAGKALKEPDTIHWQYPNSATGNLGFNALPGGQLHHSGQFMLLGYEAGFWNGSMAEFVLYNNRDNVESLQNPGNVALSVRCVRTDDQK